MANGRLLDADRETLKRMVTWEYLYRANPYPLTPDESYDMYWMAFTAAQRNAFHELISNPDTMDYVELSEGTMYIEVDHPLILTDDYQPRYDSEKTSPKMHLIAPDKKVFPQKNGWNSKPPMLTKDNPYYDRMASYIQEASTISHIIDVCTDAVDDIAMGIYSLNTYGQVKRIWPDIIQVCPPEWQTHIAEASRSSRLPDMRTEEEWRRIQRGFELVSNYAVQAMMLSNVDDLNTAGWHESGYDTDRKWSDWCGPKIAPPPSKEEIKMPWEL